MIDKFPYPAKPPSGCPPQLPPQELLDRKSEEKFEAEEKEKKCRPIDGKVVWQDAERKLYFEGDAPVLIYKNERYTFGCQPYEPMLIIRLGNDDKVFVHNAFYPDECKEFIQNSHYLVCTITGRHHNAERFCRLLTAAIDCYFDCQIDDVEKTMQEQLVEEKGIHTIQFEPIDFKCDKVLYEGVSVLLGNFETLLSKKHNIKIYSIAFGYPNGKKEEYEYYLLTPMEYEEFMLLPENRQWKSNDEPLGWQHDHLEGKKQVLCNEFTRNPAIYKPYFTLYEIPEN